MAVDREWYNRVVGAIGRGIQIIREEDSNQILFVTINYAWIAEELRTPVRLLKELLDGGGFHISAIELDFQLDGEDWRERVKKFIYPADTKED